MDRKTEQLDYDQIEKLAKEFKPRLIVAGASAYARTIDFKIFRQIADKVGAKLMVDMAHIAGMVAAGLHPSPVPYADIVTSTTHKTLRGARGGFILCPPELGAAVDSAVFLPGGDDAGAGVAGEGRTGRMWTSLRRLGAELENAPVGSGCDRPSTSRA